MDKILYASLMLIAMYGFAVAPFHTILLLKHTLLHMWLTGLNLSVPILASENEDRPLFFFVVVVIVALSTIKFMPPLYWMGKKWGPEFITVNFGGHLLRWSKEMENLIYERIGLNVLASSVLFLPIPTTIVAAIGGTVKARDQAVGVYPFLCAAMLKCFYLYLGLTFGPSIQGSLQTIDRYVTYITFALIGWMFLSIWWKNKKSSGQVA